MLKAAGRIKTSIINLGNKNLGEIFIFIPEQAHPRLVSIITFCCVRIRVASFLAISRRGCNVNSPGRRTSILQVGHADLTDISSALNHFCSSVMVNPKKISAVGNS
jgi:hypothetical protein